VSGRRQRRLRRAQRDKARENAELVTLPSGNTPLLRVPELGAILEWGDASPSLLELIRRFFAGEFDQDVVYVGEQLMVAAAFAEPYATTLENAGPGEISLRDLSTPDHVFVRSWIESHETNQAEVDT
jgi:hypothetical protein